VLDSLYFSVVTLTTEGFGEFSPQTDFGKIFTIIYMFTVVGPILGFINKLALHMGRSKSRKQDERER
jgi:voltage-gated potassium channel